MYTLENSVHFYSWRQYNRILLFSVKTAGIKETSAKCIDSIHHIGSNPIGHIINQSSYQPNHKLISETESKEKQKEPTQQ